MRQFATTANARARLCPRPIWTRLLALVTLTAAFGMAGCAASRQLEDGTTVRVTRAELPEYTLEVFRRHNAATLALMHCPVETEEDARRMEDMYDLETDMQLACEALDRVAAAYRDGRAPGWWEKIRLPRTLAPCVEATRALETALEALARDERCPGRAAAGAQR